MSNSSNREVKVFELSDGDVYCWVDHTSIMLKSVTKFGDPVELNSEEARSLAAQLLRLAEDNDSGPLNS